MKKIYILQFFVLIFLCMLLFFVNTSFAVDEFKYHSMFPKIQQPWYFWGPNSIAVTQNGALLIADTENNRMLKYNSQGQLITTWGRYGDNDGEFYDPSALAVDSSGNIYVLDSGNSRVQKFDENGIFMLSWGSFGSDEGEFKFVGPAGDIAVDGYDNIYVADCGNNRVQIFSNAGKYLGVISGDCEDPCIPGYIFDGTEISQECPDQCYLFRPSGLAFDSQGNLYVANQGTEDSPDEDAPDLDGYRIDNIVKFSSTAEFLLSFAGTGSGQGELTDPSGMTFDKDDNLYVTDSGNHMIQVFSTDGTFIESFGSEGSGDGEFNTPTDILFGPNEIIFIADKENNRIQKFYNNKIHINSWASGGEQQGSFLSPVGIAIDSDNNIYVADTNNHRIQKLDADGNVLMVIGGYGEGNSQFKQPVDVTVDFDGNIFVVDGNNHRIQKFHSNGTFIFAWGMLGLEEGHFNNPRGIATDSYGNIYVVDGENRVQKFTNDGQFIKSWGEAENLDHSPTAYGVTVDHQNNVYVSDYYDHFSSFHNRQRIQKFTSEGEFIMSWGALGSDPGKFDHPMGVATDSSGNVYVADMFNDRIQKFNSQGDYLGSVGEFGSGQAQLIQPTDVAVASDGTMFVVDSFNNRISVFKPVEAIEPAFNKKALIVAGGGPYPGNTLWDTTRTCANFAYRTLLHKGYPKESIYYLCEDNALDIDGNGLFDDIYGAPTLESIEKIITETASSAEELILYFVDHGDEETFLLDSLTELSAESLDQWLDTYEASSGGKTLLVYDACRSGSFLSSLTPYTSGSRTVITSTDSDEYAYFISSGTISFSEYFWTSVFNGHDALTSFMQAQQGMTILEISQTPQTDANGNGIGNEAEDYDALSLCTALDPDSQTGSDHQLEPGTETNDLPVIGVSQPMILVDGTGRALVAAETVVDSDGIDRVWATIISPDYSPVSSDIPVTELPEIDLKPVETGEGTSYQAWYDNFTEPGAYRVTFYARDKKGNNAKPMTTLFVTEQTFLPKAVIVTSQSSDPVRTSIYQYLGDHSQKALAVQGFSDERIKRLHGVHASEIETAITGWASDTDNLTLYFVGDGESSNFLLTPEYSLSAASLASYIDQYQSIASGHVNVIIDADASGTFMSALKNNTEAGRIVFSSTYETGKAFFETNGLISFSSYFWNAISKGSTILHAFVQAYNAVNYISQSFVYLDLTDNFQYPQIDDDGNGIPNEDSDGYLAKETSIGIGIITGADGFITGDIPDTITLEGEISSMMTVSDIRSVNEIVRVWALITPPIIQDTQTGLQDGEDSVSFSLPVVNLFPFDGGYKWMYSGFSEKGTYLIDFYAMDDQDTVELLGRTTVVQDQLPPEPLVVGGEPGSVIKTVRLDSDVILKLAISVDIETQNNIAGEWVIFAFSTTDGELSFCLLSPSGIIDISTPGTNIWDYTYPFDHTRDIMRVASLNFESLGLGKGDIFAYDYVYTTDSSIDNIFHANAVFSNTVILYID